LYKETGKNREKYEGAVDLLGKILKNVIDNPTEEKYRSFRRDNPKIKEKLTGYKCGVELVKLIGFQEDDATGEIIYRINSSVSVSFIKVRFN
jgi:hypothetical protein